MKTAVKTIIVLIGVLCGACANGNSTVATDYDSQLMALEDDIATLIADATCVSDSDCATMAYGHRACGGPSGYLVYSTLSTDAVELETLVTEYTDLEEAAHAESGEASICEYEMEPEVGCIESACQEIDS